MNLIVCTFIIKWISPENIYQIEGVVDWLRLLNWRYLLPSYPSEVQRTRLTPLLSEVDFIPPSNLFTFYYSRLHKFQKNNSDSCYVFRRILEPIFKQHIIFDLFFILNDYTNTFCHFLSGKSLIKNVVTIWDETNNGFPTLRINNPQYLFCHFSGCLHDNSEAKYFLNRT